ncbi:MAG: cold shock domain-containing protein [Kiloniellales bacterium]|nr:cold shock domain-containing protein [Kiloniellales bacterium]MDJ0982323.1 cold shock domain-containing protein [Kiloniellales bacterium]
MKAHEVSPHGKVSALQAYEGYGFVTLTDGQEVYLHKNAVVNGAFNKIAIGDEVRVALIEGENDKAPRATTVIPIGKYYLAGR